MTDRPIHAEIAFDRLEALLLTRADSEDAYLLHELAQQWALATALAINSRADFQCLPKIAVDPYEHQVAAAITYFRRLTPRGMIADDVGLGKTITAGLILSELMRRKKVRTCIIVCPKLIMAQWKSELETKFKVPEDQIAVGSGGAFVRGLKSQQIVITTYATARAHMDHLVRRGSDTQSMLIMDEAHYVRNLHGARKPAQQAKVFHETLSKRAFRYVLQLTATPLQTSVWDLYSLADMLRTPDPNPFGPQDRFESEYLDLNPSGKSRKVRQILPFKKEEFRRRLSEIMVRTRRKDTKLNFPKRDPKNHYLTPTPGEQKFIRAIITFALGMIGSLEQSTLILSALSSPWSAAKQLENKLDSLRAKGADPSPLIEEGRRFTTSAKLNALRDIIRSHRSADPTNWRVLVFASRLKTLDFIREGLRQDGLEGQIGFVRGDSPHQSQTAIDAFMADSPRNHLLVSTDAGAIGINLQKCNVVVNFDLPWNPMILEQRIGRVQRLGQTKEHVVVHNLVVQGTVEETVVLRLLERLNLFEVAIGEMEAVLQMVMGEDGGDSFAEVLLNMVRKAMENKDIEADLAAQAASVAAARERMRELEQVNDRMVGSVDPESVDEALPNLTPTKPDVPLDQFILRALTYAKGTWSLEKDGMTYRVSNPERGLGGVGVTFNPDHPMFAMERLGAATVTLYAEGERDFEHEVQRWTSSHRCLIRDLSISDPKQMTDRLAACLAVLGWKPEGALSPCGQRTELKLMLRPLWRARIAVFHDQYEKLLRTGLERPEHGFPQIPSEGPIITELPESLAKPLAAALKTGQSRIESTAFAAANADSDLQNFAAFYRKRQEIEVARIDRFMRENAGRDRETLLARRADAQRRFGPQIDLDPVGIEIYYYNVAHIAVEATYGTRHTSVILEFVPRTGAILTPWFSFDTGKPLHAPVICVGGHIVNQEDLTACSETDCRLVSCGRCAPAEFGPCAVCEVSLCQDHRKRCARCGTWLCSIHARATRSGQTACDECSGTCAKDGALHLAQELECCTDCREEFCAQHRQACAGCDKVFCDAHTLLAADGMPVCPQCSDLCTVDQARLPRSELRACRTCESLVCTHHRVECPHCRRPLCPTHTLKTAREQIGCEACTGTCARTHERHALADLATCAVTGQRVRADLVGTSAISGRKILLELLVACEVSEALALPNELAVCELTGKRVQPSLLGVCPDTKTRALLSLFQRCEETNAPVVPAALAKCEKSGKIVRRRLLQKCEVSGSQVLPTFLSQCGVTGKFALTELGAISPVSSRWALREVLVPCEVTGTLVLPGELQMCSETGKNVLPRLLSVCPDSGKQALASAFQVCRHTQVAVLPEALAVCRKSGLTVRRNQLEHCVMSGSVVLPRYLRPSDASGRRALTEHGFPSAVSGKWVLKDEVALCQETGEPALPDELQACEATGKRVVPRLLAKCADSSKRVLAAQLRECEQSHEKVLPECLGTCAKSRRQVRIKLLGRCEVTAQHVLPEFLRPSDVSGRKALIECGAPSAVSGKWALLEEMLKCEVSGDLALPEEFVFCTVSGKRVLPKLTGKCAVTGRVALREYLTQSAVSGKLVLTSLLIPCAVTRRLALESELATCGVSRKRVIRSLLEKCAATGTEALPEYLDRCEIGNRRILKSELGRCAKTKRVVERRLLVPCAVSQALVLPECLAKCVITGNGALLEHMRTSELSGRSAIPDHVRVCLSCDKRVLVDEVKRCPSCAVPLCEGCVPETCLGCRAVLDPAGPVVPTNRLPGALLARHPQASQWRYAVQGRLHYGVGYPGFLRRLLHRPKLLVLAEDPKTKSTRLLCDKNLK